MMRQSVVNSIQAYQEAAPAHILVESNCAWRTTTKEGGEEVAKSSLSEVERVAQELDGCLSGYAGHEILDLAFLGKSWQLEQPLERLDVCTLRYT
jgi:hypothetical protein